ncbi:MAG: hypothetical protein AAGB03_12440, partial [Pseudomonadota bacterium]
ARENEGALPAWIALFERTLGETGSDPVTADDLRFYKLIAALRAPVPSLGSFVLSLPERLAMPAETLIFQRAKMEYHLLDALGVDMPSEARLLALSKTISARSDLADTAMLGRLETASLRQRKAETAVFAIHTIGARGLGRADPVSLASVVRAFSRVDMDREAKAFMIEALLSLP